MDRNKTVGSTNLNAHGKGDSLGSITHSTQQLIQSI